VKVKVQSVKRNDDGLSFSCVDLTFGRAFSCTPSLRFMLCNPSFEIEAGDELLLGDFIPDLVTRQVGPIHLMPEAITKLRSGRVVVDV